MAATTTIDALRAACLADPEAPEPRLILADALGELGEADCEAWLRLDVRCRDDGRPAQSRASQLEWWTLWDLAVRLGFYANNPQPEPLCGLVPLTLPF